MSNMLQVSNLFSTSTRVFIDQGNDDPCAFTTEAADGTSQPDVGAGAELWRSGRCFSVCQAKAGDGPEPEVFSVGPDL